MECHICNQKLLFGGNTCSRCAGELVNGLRRERDALKAALEKIAADLPIHDGFSSKSKEAVAKEALGK